MQIQHRLKKNGLFKRDLMPANKKKPRCSGSPLGTSCALGLLYFGGYHLLINIFLPLKKKVFCIFIFL